MRILHIYKDYYPVWGGIENHVRWLAEAQARAGHHVSVLVTNTSIQSSYSIEDGVRVLRAGRLATVASTPLSLRLPWLVKQQKRVDVTHLHYPFPPGEVSQWLFGQSICTVIGYHADIVRQKRLLRLYHPIVKRVLASADAILVNNGKTLRSSPLLSPLQERCTLVPLGIPLEPYTATQSEQALALRERFGTPLLLFVGALRYYKGLQYLVRALVQVPEATLIIAGDGVMRQQWESETRALGLSSRVHFVGRVERSALPHYYRACDIFVLPACEKAEAFGLAQVEAMASGRPVVGTEVGTGTSVVNKHGVTGLVVPPKNPQALASAINQLLADDQLRLAMGQAAKDRAQREYGLDLMVKRVMGVYHRVLTGDSAA